MWWDDIYAALCQKAAILQWQFAKCLAAACMTLLILRGTSANCIFLLYYFDDNSNSFSDDSPIGRKLSTAESVATLPPFSPIEGQKWFDQISSQWESQKNRFELIYFGKIQFLPPCIWNLPFMSTASERRETNKIRIGSNSNDDTSGGSFRRNLKLPNSAQWRCRTGPSVNVGWNHVYPT